MSCSICIRCDSCECKIYLMALPFKTSHYQLLEEFVIFFFVCFFIIFHRMCHINFSTNFNSSYGINKSNKSFEESFFPMSVGNISFLFLSGHIWFVTLIGVWSWIQFTWWSISINSTFKSHHKCNKTQFNAKVQFCALMMGGNIHPWVEALRDEEIEFQTSCILRNWNLSSEKNA